MKNMVRISLLMIMVSGLALPALSDTSQISHDTCALMLERDQFDGDRGLRMKLYRKGYKLFFYDYDLLSEARFNDREALAHLKKLPFSALILNSEMDVNRRYLSGWTKMQKYTFAILEVDGRIDPIDLRNQDSPNGYVVAYRGANASVIARGEKTFENSLFDFGTNWDGAEERVSQVFDRLPDCRLNYN